MKYITLVSFLVSSFLFAETITCKTFISSDPAEGLLLSTNRINLRKDDPADGFTVENRVGEVTYILSFSVWRQDNSTRHVVEGTLSMIAEKDQKHVVSGFREDVSSLGKPLDYKIYMYDLKTGLPSSSFRVHCQ